MSSHSINSSNNYTRNIMRDLPPGFRFYPTEEELICFYLRNKLDNRRDDIDRVIPVVDVCSFDPWQLSEMHQRQSFAGKEEPWFYFCPRQEKEARGGRPKRTTPSGYWKAAGTPGVAHSAEHRPIGTKKTMVFYRGRAPGGTKTNWKMNEYRAFQDSATAGGGGGGCSSTSTAPNPYPQTRSEFSLCRLYTKPGCQRQFNCRPLAVAAGGAGKNLGPSSAAADDERGVKRKRSGPSGDTSSDDDGADGSRGYMQQQQLMPRGTDDVCVDNVADWTDFFDWFSYYS